MDRVRVLVIDDSAFMRKMLSNILASDDRIQVIDTARNGEEGLNKMKTLDPDVITLDVNMPIMDGITTLKKIMETHPLPVVMLTGVTSIGAFKTHEAISSGAIDFITKPSGTISLDIETIKEEVIEKVLAASKVQVPVPESKTYRTAVTPITDPIQQKHAKTVVAIGASTGGPRALQRLLTDLPSDFSPPLLIVQHMPAGFTKSLADRLNALTEIHVKEATHGEILKNKTAYIAPGNYHMRIRQLGMSSVIELAQDDFQHGHRPAVDALFESVSKLVNVNKIAVVLTGMGNDGAKGIKQLKKKDPSTIVIAEAKESAIIYGMPKAAVQTNVVTYIVHLHQVGTTIGNLTKKPGET